MYTLGVVCCSLLVWSKFLHGIKSWIFLFCGGLSMFPLSFYKNFSLKKTCVDSALSQTSTPAESTQHRAESTQVFEQSVS